MEQLLHYVWKHRLFPLNVLQTTHGVPLEVIDVGLGNRDAGPDFFNAKVRLGDTIWVGNVEIHLRASDWTRHGHDKDAAYDNVVLHVVSQVDAEVSTSQGRVLPQLQLSIPQVLLRDYEYLLTIDNYPRCFRIIPTVDATLVYNWMDILLQERLRQRAARVTNLLYEHGGDWEKTLFITLARNFGFGLNGDAFQAWAALLPLNQLGKHRDELFQIEAVFLGLAGMLSPDKCYQGTEDEYRRQLAKEYAYQQRLFRLPPAVPLHYWRYLRLRPQNFPHIRLAQLAWMYSQGRLTLSGILDAVRSENPLKSLLDVLHAETSLYWQTHLVFGKPLTRQRRLSLSNSTRYLLVINTVVPVLYAYAVIHDDSELSACLKGLMERLPAENNHILRLWQECGLEVKSAADSQALIHLKREYCDRRDCLRCRFGHVFLSKKLQL